MPSHPHAGERAGRRTKIVATVGPASSAPARLADLVAAGVDVFRLNLSHAAPDQHLATLAAIRAAAADAGRSIGVLADLPGPKVRSGVFPDGGVFLAEGTEVLLVPGTGACDAGRITVDYASLIGDLRAGDAVILGDGAITLRVRALTSEAAVTSVETGGRVQGRPGVHIPSERMRLTAPTAQDLELIEAVVPAGIDFLAVSFVRGGDDLRTVRHAIAALGPDVPMPMLVAKIETAPAIAALDDILAATDAVMVARGDLGIEVPLEDVPHVQKRVIRACVTAGIPVITATQMLESMIHAPAPTRAEVSDVANAVFDGTDAVMLSAETAIGHDPVEVVRTMARIARRAESASNYEEWAVRLSGKLREDTDHAVTAAMTHAAWQAALDAGCRAVLCCTRSGFTARSMARFRPRQRMLGLSPEPRTCNQLTLSWGVEPMAVDPSTSVDEVVWFAVERAVQAGVVAAGDRVAVLAGAPDSPGGSTDVLRIVEVR